jgi:hypothetical protein
MANYAAFVGNPRNAGVLFRGRRARILLAEVGSELESGAHGHFRHAGMFFVQHWWGWRKRAVHPSLQPPHRLRCEVSYCTLQFHDPGRRSSKCWLEYPVGASISTWTSLNCFRRCIDLAAEHVARNQHWSNLQRRVAVVVHRPGVHRDLGVHHPKELQERVAEVEE